MKDHCLGIIQCLLIVTFDCLCTTKMCLATACMRERSLCLIVNFDCSCTTKMYLATACMDERSLFGLRIIQCLLIVNFDCLCTTKMYLATACKDERSLWPVANYVTSKQKKNKRISLKTEKLIPPIFIRPFTVNTRPNHPLTGYS